MARPYSMTLPFIEQALLTASPDSCLLDWPYSVHHKNRRPQVIWEQRKTGAVHYAFFLLHGRRPQRQLNHSCNDYRCWNPHHVYEGTQRQNIHDMDRAGRRHLGRTAKLTAHDAEEIRRLHGLGAMGKDLAEKYQVTKSTISEVINHKRWRTPVTQNQ